MKKKTKSTEYGKTYYRKRKAKGETPWSVWLRNPIEKELIMIFLATIRGEEVDQDLVNLVKDFVNNITLSGGPEEQKRE